MTSFDPFVALSLSLAALICLLGPLALAYWWRDRTGMSFKVFGWGAVVFLVSQVVLRLPWQIPLSRWISANHRSWTVVFLIFSALTAGLFEEGGRWVGYRTVLKAERSRNAGIMYGLGHGACESILLVGVPILALLVASMLATYGMISGPSVLAAIREQSAALTGWGAQLAVIERASTMASHVGLSLIVLQAFTRRSNRWLVVAILLHAAIDATATVSLHSLHIPTPYVELLIGVIALGILWIGLRLASASTISPSRTVSAS